jgi:hypothetical protein
MHRWKQGMEEPAKTLNTESEAMATSRIQAAN